MIVRDMKAHYPNLATVFLSSRIYAGYATDNLNPEPYAYESGFAVKWLIEAQINQVENNKGADPTAGDLDYTLGHGTAPWLAWGPYTWADGTKGCISTGISYQQSDFESDGGHPSSSGQAIVGGALLDFFKSSSYTPWFRP